MIRFIDGDPFINVSCWYTIMPDDKDRSNFNSSHEYACYLAARIIRMWQPVLIEEINNDLIIWGDQIK